jgi:predicted HD phosphohydrolase
MSPAEVRAFERLSHHEAATLVRRWDDRAKVAGLAVADLDAYRSLLDRLSRRRGLPTNR